MMSLQDRAAQLMAKENTVHYVQRNYPDAMMDLDKDMFVDDSINVANADDFDFRLVDNHPTAANQQV